VLTIGQLATHAGVTVKAIRVYHAKGLLPEPARDAAGYRRYDAQAIIEVTRIATLAQAGVPLARVPDVLDADGDDLGEQIARVDAELRHRIRLLEQRLCRLQHLDQPDRLCLPAEAVQYLDRLDAIGLSERHQHAIRDAWILGFALAPELARALLGSHTALLDDEEYVAMLHGYDDAIDRSPDDPRLEQLADAAAALVRRMTTVSDLPEFRHVPPEVVDLLTAYVGVDSDAWPQLDRLLADRLRRPGDDTPRSHGAFAPQGAVSSDRSPGWSTRPSPPVGPTG
jgi:DNA-binding transcriptional MerR regulator